MSADAIVFTYYNSALPELLSATQAKQLTTPQEKPYNMPWK
jgi:hypothetical protein